MYNISGGIMVELNRVLKKMNISAYNSHCALITGSACERFCAILSTNGAMMSRTKIAGRNIFQAQINLKINYL